MRPARWLAIAAGLAVAAGALGVSVTPARTWRLVDTHGRPVAGAYLAYHYIGREYRVVDSGAYRRPGALVRSDPAGRVRLPWAVHVHRPRPLQGGPEPYLDLVYAPALHNAFGRLGLAPRGDPAVVALPGRFALDRGAGVATLADLRDDPPGWAATLDALYGFVRFDVIGRGPDEVRAAGPLLRELAARIEAEYRGFLARHGEVAREGPGEPRWAPFMERLWRDRLAELARQLPR